MHLPYVSLEESRPLDTQNGPRRMVPGDVKLPCGSKHAERNTEHWRYALRFTGSHHRRFRPAADRMLAVNDERRNSAGKGTQKGWKLPAEAHTRSVIGVMALL